MAANSNETKEEEPAPAARMSATARAPSQRQSKARRDSQRSSVFGRARMSFVRSGGKRGAALENLRGTRGAAFEGKADVERVNQASMGMCGCMGGGSGLDKNVIVLVKGPFAFIFNSETAASPKYAISLANMKPVTKSTRGTFAVTLETSLGDAEYEFSFADAEAAASFGTAVEQESAAGKAELVRKRLGHEHLLNKRASIRYAESVAVKKVDDAPAAPVSTEEILAGVAAAAM